MNRRDEIANNLLEVQQRITRACAQANRNVDEITVIGVTKTHPVSDIRILMDLGIRNIAESKVQESGDKFDELHTEDLTWHFVGQLQTNKVNKLVRYVNLIHSVDRPKLVDALNRTCESLNHTLPVLIQVNLDPAADETRGGVQPEEIEELAAHIEQSVHLRLAGLMAVAPLDAEPAQAFERLAEIVRAFQKSHPQATVVSAGMSDDFEYAIKAGATHLRLGSVLLGTRG
jgi:pyridoxal phosphate enzyme (YggS family)